MPSQISNNKLYLKIAYKYNNNTALLHPNVSLIRIFNGNVFSFEIN